MEVNSALIQPKDREYRLKGREREQHIEIKRNGIAHALRTGGQILVAIEGVEIEKE